MEIALGNISTYWRDLDTVKGRQTRYGGSGGGRGGDKPLPVDLRFLGATEDGSLLQEACKNTIATWTRIVMEEKPALAGPVHASCLHVTCSQMRRSRYPRDEVGSCCLYLLGHADWIRTKDWAPEILDELDNLEAQLRRFVDRPRDRWYAGPCADCGKALYAKAGATYVTCEACGISYHVEDRRADMLNRAYDLCATASEIARAISWLGHEVINAERIRKWVERGRLERKGWLTVRGRELPTYRIGDVAALVEAASRTQKEAG
jgi:hypothetical protein